MRIQNNIYNNETNFNGLNLFSKFSKGSMVARQTRAVTTRVGNVLNQPNSVIEPLVQDVSEDKVRFLDKLTQNYVHNNFVKSDSAQSILKIYNSVAKPEYEHFNIVSKSQMPIDSLEAVFENASDRSSLGFVQMIQHDVLDGSKESAEQIVDMLKSPHRETYLKSPEDYKSYLILNYGKPDSVKVLDTLIDEGKYDRKIYDTKLAVSDMFKNKQLKSAIGETSGFVEQNYTKEGEKFLNRLTNDYLIHHKNEYTSNDKNNIIMMFETSTPENIASRLEVMDNFKTVDIIGQSDGSALNSMRVLFSKMDNDKHVAGFVHNILGDGLKIESIRELNRVIDMVPSKKAEIFHRNIARIVKNTNVEEREQAIFDNIENPFFVNKKEGSPKQDGIVKKFAKLVENKINLHRYNRLTAKQSDTQELIFKPAREEVVSDNISKSEEKSFGIRKLSFSLRKLKIKSDISEIIRNKLGQKTLDRQEEAYSQQATKIRLKLLPDIFKSITETRKSQRAEGKVLSVDNRDALKLYAKTQGKNKKLVRYMLNKTDENNKHIFNVKDIIKVIDDTELKIKDSKKINPEYRAKDAKAEYDTIYQGMVEKYGKLKTAKKS